LALAAIIIVQRFFHYIFFHTTMVIAHSNPMYHILTRQVLGGKYSKWIVIIQELDLNFSKSKDKKSLVFVELIFDLPHTDENIEPNYFVPDDSLFLISMFDVWYRDILLYIYTQCFKEEISHDEQRRIRHHSKYYLIVGDTLYHFKQVLNNCHLGSCGGHLSRMATAQKIIHVGYF
jgi:hypothetical protein